jgi:hypothetical protein
MINLYASLTGAVVLSAISAGPLMAQAPIAEKPPSFRFYDVDKRERWLERSMAHLAGTRALSHAAADADLAKLNDIRQDEAARRDRHGGHLTRSDLRVVNGRLNRLADSVGLR